MIEGVSPMKQRRSKAEKKSNLNEKKEKFENEEGKNKGHWSG